MPRFLITMTKDNRDQSQPPPPKLMEALGKLVQDNRKNGVLFLTGALAPPRRLRAENATLLDGPYAETKELIAGFAIINAQTMDDALGEARKFMQMHVDALGPSWHGEAEVRQILEGG